MVVIQYIHVSDFPQFIFLYTFRTYYLQKDPGSELSYGDVGYHALGNFGRLLVECAIILSQTGRHCVLYITTCNLYVVVWGFLASLQLLCRFYAVTSGLKTAAS